MTTDEMQALFDTPPRRLSARRLFLALVAFGCVAAIVAVAIVARNQPEALAELRVRSGNVDIIRAQRGTIEGDEGDELRAGDVLRTQPGSQAQVDFYDSSLVRIDERTVVELDRIDQVPLRSISLDIEGGRLWNRVATIDTAEDRYEVQIGDATATVVGTTFLVDCRRIDRDRCYVLGVEGTTTVEASRSEASMLGSGDCVELPPSGEMSACNERKLGLIDDWVKQNLAEDQQLQLDELSERTPTATRSPSPTAAPPAPAPQPRATPSATKPATPTPEPTDEPSASPSRRSPKPKPKPTKTPATPTPTAPLPTVSPP